MASLLTSEMHSTDGVVKYIAECRHHDIPILPPDINQSEVEFTVDGSQIRFGLVAVKNVGESAIESIIAGRTDQPLESLFDFCERVDLKKVNKRVIESLIKCGAFDGSGLLLCRGVARFRCRRAVDVEFIAEAIHERCPTGIDDILRHAHGVPDPFAVGGFDKHPHLGRRTVFA